jgi:hypothetical protein
MLQLPRFNPILGQVMLIPLRMRADGSSRHTPSVSRAGAIARQVRTIYDNNKLYTVIGF